MISFKEIIISAKGFFDYLSTFDYTGVILVIMMIVMWALFMKMNKSRSSTFFYDQLFIDPDGKASTSKLAQMIALLLSSWAFVHLTIKGTLTEWFFFGYLSAWIFNRGFTKWIDLQKSLKDND